MQQGVMAWLADIIQNPTKKPGTALVLRGKQGTGKSIIVQIMRKLLGVHCVSLSKGGHFTGRFNSRLDKCLLLGAEEAFLAGDKDAEGVLKDLITGDKHTIEFKNIDPIEMDNYIRVLITSNHHWVVPAGMEERRMAVFDVGDEHMQDHAYFAAMIEQMEKGGYKALLDYMMKLDLSGVNLRVVPTTQALFEQKMENATDEMKWWYGILVKGSLPKAEAADPTICRKDAFYEDYLHTAKNIGARRRALQTVIGTLIKNLHPNAKESRVTFKVYEIYSANNKDERKLVLRFPPLQVCREEFEAAMHQSIDWPADPSVWVAEPSSAGADHHLQDEGSGPKVIAFRDK